MARFERWRKKTPILLVGNGETYARIGFIAGVRAERKRLTGSELEPEGK